MKRCCTKKPGAVWRLAGLIIIHGSRFESWQGQARHSSSLRSSFSEAVEGEAEPQVFATQPKALLSAACTLVDGAHVHTPSSVWLTRRCRARRHWQGEECIQPPPCFSPPMAASPRSQWWKGLAASLSPRLNPQTSSRGEPQGQHPPRQPSTTAVLKPPTARTPQVAVVVVVVV
ncbi:hypothetical protein E2C01_072359 [Portunus trituberculatus]|uniref:Uncharacterized protein n=1 Tax=Portunus trituberculatus TaxID=210409 RepID=A0A5B7HZN6_PORTR|nr:hypothetical protein [Portunus trituberculatus]